MNLTHLEAIHVIQKVSYSIDPGRYSHVDVSVHPPFTALRSVQTVLEADDISIALGAQNAHWEPSGAYTGEISPLMLAKLNVRYVIVGHSERRQLFGETDDMVARKVAAVFKAGMTPIMCVGETLEEREAGGTEPRVLGQLQAGLAGLNPEQVGSMVVAYEPIWAIGTGRTATPDDAQAVCATIRAAVSSDHGSQAGGSIRVQYGGSVKRSNIGGLMAQPDIDGALVGGASLDPVEFAEIVAFSGS
ncbi:MAG: triose-phosphate isomerase [Acidimicrobiales bacterium]|nr:triose-phosphate isomerase [Acidimicrobiales bacterium]